MVRKRNMSPHLCGRHNRWLQNQRCCIVTSYSIRFCHPRKRGFGYILTYFPWASVFAKATPRQARPRLIYEPGGRQLVARWSRLRPNGLRRGKGAATRRLAWATRLGVALAKTEASERSETRSPEPGVKTKKYQNPERSEWVAERDA